MAHANAQQRCKLELKAFTGTETPLEARIWLRKVEAYGAVCRLNGEQLAQAVSFALSDRASLWYGTFEEGEDDRIEDWATFRPLFENRFCRTLSSTEVSQLSLNLKQTAKETVDEFQDRCQEAQYLEEAGLDAVTKQAIPAEAFQALHQNGVTIKFLNGLQDRIREKVTNADTAASLEDFLRAARRAESSIRDQRPNVSNVFELQDGGGESGNTGDEDQREGVDTETEDGSRNESGDGATGHGHVESVNRGGPRRGAQVGLRGHFSNGRGNSNAARNTNSAGGQGWKSNQATSRPNNNTGGQGPPLRQCWTCGEIGHFRANCPRAQNKGHGYGRTGFHNSAGRTGTGSSGEKASRSPQQIGQLAEVITNALLALDSPGHAEASGVPENGQGTVSQIQGEDSTGGGGGFAGIGTSLGFQGFH